MKKICFLFVLLFFAVILSAQDQPTDDQLVINFLKAQNALQARLIENLQKQIASQDCKPKQ